MLESARTELSLDYYSALSAIERGQFTDHHLAVVGGAIRLALEFVDKINEREAALDCLEKGRAAFWRTVKRWEKGNTQDADDLQTLRAAVTVSDDVIRLMERHEILYAANKVLKDGIKSFEK